MGLPEILHSSTRETLEHVQLAEHRLRKLIEACQEDPPKVTTEHFEALEEALSLAADWAAAASAVAQRFHRPPAPLKQPQWVPIHDGIADGAYNAGVASRSRELRTPHRN